MGNLVESLSFCCFTCRNLPNSIPSTRAMPSWLVTYQRLVSEWWDLHKHQSFKAVTCKFCFNAEYGPIVEVKFIHNLVKSRLSSHPGRGGLGGALVRFPNLLRLVGESDWGGGICHYLGRVVYKVGKIGENFLKAKYYEPV